MDFLNLGIPLRNMNSRNCLIVAGPVYIPFLHQNLAWISTNSCNLFTLFAAPRRALNECHSMENLLKFPIKCLLLQRPLVLCVHSSMNRWVESFSKKLWYGLCTIKSAFLIKLWKYFGLFFCRCMFKCQAWNDGHPNSKDFSLGKPGLRFANLKKHHRPIVPDIHIHHLS